MKINQENAKRLKEIAESLIEQLDEFKHICRNSMSSSEYQQFKYRCLGNLEPGLREDSEWVTRYSSIDSLEKVADNALNDADSDLECEDCGKLIPYGGLTN